MRVLVIEDEHKIARAIQKGLSLEGFAVDAAYDGEVGLRMAKDTEYDAIVLDLMLPKLDGLSLLTKLRESGNHTPVLILTAKDSVQDKVKGLNIGADDYLPKPFAFVELIARIQALIRRSTTKDPVLTFADVSLDPRTHIVTRDGKQLELSVKEFSLLEYLMRHPGAIMSEAQILEHVWDYSYDGLSNVVAVHIKNLRQKLDKAFPKSPTLIHTVRGLGYQLKSDEH